MSRFGWINTLCPWRRPTRLRYDARLGGVAEPANLALEYHRARGGGGGSCPFWNSRDALAPRGIGKSVRRREDIRLLTGRGRYAADFSLPGQVYACYRALAARACRDHRDRYRRRRLAAPGVLAVLTGGDAAEDGLRPIPHSPVPTNPHEVPLKSRDGSDFFLAPHPVLAWTRCVMSASRWRLSWRKR